MRRSRALILAVATVLAAPPARAGIDASDLQIAARALSFMQNPPAGSVRVGIVYDPNNPQSAAEAEALQNILQSDPKTGSLVLRPELLKPEDADGAAVGLFLLTDGVGAGAGEIAHAARAKHIPCVTGDFTQVRDGACAIGVRSNPRIEILVNRDAAAASGVAFSTAFRMLITEF
jgi:hypothetical protein